MPVTFLNQGLFFIFPVVVGGIVFIGFSVEFGLGVGFGVSGIDELSLLLGNGIGHVNDLPVQKGSESLEIGIGGLLVMIVIDDRHFGLGDQFLDLSNNIFQTFWGESSGKLGKSQKWVSGTDLFKFL